MDKNNLTKHWYANGNEQKQKNIKNKMTNKKSSMCEWSYKTEDFKKKTHYGKTIKGG